MSTPAELGLDTPGLNDLIRDGADNITTNAEVLAALYDELLARRSEATLLTTGEDLDNLTAEREFFANTNAISTSIMNRPPLFTGSPFAVKVTQISTASGIVEQRAVQKVAGGDGASVAVRYSVSGNFGPWLADNPAGVMTTDENLNGFIGLGGTRRADTSTVSATIVNKPPWFATSPFSVTVTPVSLTNGIFEQRAVQKVAGSGEWREAVRYSLSGNFETDWIDVRSGTGATRDRNWLTIFGNSQSDTPDTWDKHLAPLLTDTTINNFARSGSSTNETELMTGILELPVEVAGGAIPASGSVTLTSRTRLSLRNDRLIVGGRIAGVGGSLTHVSGDTYTFTRATAGVAVPAAGWQFFRSSFSTNAHAIINYSGGNNFGQNVTGQERSIADHTIGHYRRFVEWAHANGYRPILGGVTNRLNEGPGSEGFAQVEKINNTLRDLYPDIFLDIQLYLSQRAIYDTDLTPTPDDLAAMAAGAIPPQFFLPGDNIHMTSDAHEALGEHWIGPWLVAKGYALTTAPVPELPVLTV